MSVKAWHFLIESHVAAGQVGIPVKKIHGGIGGNSPTCLRIIDALGYAGGNTLCCVELSDNYTERYEGTGLGLKASSETVIWRADISKILHEFACQCAERACSLISEIHPACRLAILTKRNFVEGTVGLIDLREAWEFVRAASRAKADEGDERTAVHYAMYAARHAAESVAYSSAILTSRVSAEAVAKASRHPKATVLKHELFSQEALLWEMVQKEMGS